MKRDLSWYIEKAKTQAHIKSDRQLSDMIGLSGVGIANWRRSNKAFPSDEVMVRLAQIAGIDPFVALLDLNTWRSAGDAQKTYRKILEKISVAGIALIASGLLTNAAFASNLNKINAHNININENIHYHTNRRGAILDINCAPSPYSPLD